MSSHAVTPAGGATGAGAPGSGPGARAPSGGRVGRAGDTGSGPVGTIDCVRAPGGDSAHGEAADTEGPEDPENAADPEGSEEADAGGAAAARLVRPVAWAACETVAAGAVSGLRSVRAPVAPRDAGLVVRACAPARAAARARDCPRSSTRVAIGESVSRCACAARSASRR